MSAETLRKVRCAATHIYLYCGRLRVVKRGWRNRSTSGIAARIVDGGLTIGLARLWLILGFLQDLFFCVPSDIQVWSD